MSYAYIEQMSDDPIAVDLSRGTGDGVRIRLRAGHVVLRLDVAEAVDLVDGLAAVLAEVDSSERRVDGHEVDHAEDHLRVAKLKEVLNLTDDEYSDLDARARASFGKRATNLLKTEYRELQRDEDRIRSDAEIREAL